jgi:hypothetical protein
MFKRLFGSNSSEQEDPDKVQNQKVEEKKQ